MDPVCIVGAGPAGLAAGAALKARGIPFRIVDAGPGPGGLWDISRAETPLYHSAHFISSRTLSGFPGFPMPDEYPDYPGHARVLEYLRSYADHHGLDEDSVYHTRVVDAKREAGAQGSGPWQVAVEEAGIRGEEADGGARSEGHERERRRPVGRGGPERAQWSCSALVLATGSNWHPHLPDIPGSFSGEIRHSFHYSDADEFRGRRVLVVGAGNSGVDIACDAARVADRAFLSVRRGYRFVPKYVFGTPADVFARQGPPIPAWLERRFFTFLLDRVLVGDLTRYGLPRPDHPILASHPIMNTEVLHHLGHGDLEARPDLVRFEEEEAVFQDGSRERVDLVIFATGYRRPFPFLRHPDLDPDGEWPPEVMHLNLLHRTTPDLFVMGLFETDGAAYGLFGEQAEVVARSLEVLQAGGAGAAGLAALRARDEPDLTGGRSYVDSPRHRYYVAERVYRRRLRELRAALDAL
jgi:cation diffusion facilitator CzcD-associated flavoprotein CzcO